MQEGVNGMLPKQLCSAYQIS